MKKGILVVVLSVLSGIVSAQATSSQSKEMKVEPVQETLVVTERNDSLKVDMPTSREGKSTVTPVIGSTQVNVSKETRPAQQSARKPE